MHLPSFKAQDHEDSVPSLLTYALIMDTDWVVFVEDNDNNRGQKYPLQERTGSINLCNTICHYDEENKEKKIRNRLFNAGPLA